jgi:hypothetical protein
MIVLRKELLRDGEGWLSKGVRTTSTSQQETSLGG